MIIRDILKRAVDSFPDHVALAEPGRSLTFTEAWERGCRLANLLHENGMRPGDRVASLEDNHIPAADLVLACAIGNFVRVPLYVRNAVAAHAHMIGHTDSVALIVDEQHSAVVDEIQDACPALAYVLIRDDTYEKSLAGADPSYEVVPTTEDDYHIIRHTAGTTGQSKGVGFTNRQWMTVARDFFYNVRPIEVGDTFLHMSPISHGSGYFFVPTWLAGGRNYMLPKLVPEDALRLIVEENVTHLLGIPAILSSLVRAADQAGVADLKSVKAIIVIGAPVADATIRLAHDRFGDALMTAFGQTEILPITFMGAKEWLAEGVDGARIRSAGRVHPFGQLKIVDPFTHEELPVGDEGEIAARSDGQMTGFWNDPKGTAERMVDGWILTGDVGKVDERGYLYILDRKGDTIVSGGFNIYPAELENVVAEHPDVVEVTAFAVPSERWGETPAIVCVVKDGSSVTEDEITTLVSEKLGSYKKPGTVVVTTTPLPKSAAGKILKRELREPYWAGHDRRVAGN